MTEITSDENGEQPNVVTNKQLKKYALFGIAVITLLIGFSSTWVTLQQNLEFNNGDYFLVSIDDGLDERKTTTNERLLSGSLSDSSVISEDNDEVAIAYDKTVDTKERTKNLFLGSLLLCIVGLVMIVSTSNVEYESEKIPYLPFLFAGLLLLVTSVQFAATYGPYDSTIPGNPDFFAECEEEETSGTLIWLDGSGNNCNSEAIYDVGYIDWDLEQKARPGLGFYASIIAGLSLIMIYLGRPSSRIEEDVEPQVESITVPTEIQESPAISVDDKKIEHSKLESKPETPPSEKPQIEVQETRQTDEKYHVENVGKSSRSFPFRSFVLLMTISIIFAPYPTVDTPDGKEKVSFFSAATCDLGDIEAGISGDDYCTSEVKNAALNVLFATLIVVAISYVSKLLFTDTDENPPEEEPPEF